MKESQWIRMICLKLTWGAQGMVGPRLKKLGWGNHDTYNENGEWNHVGNKDPYLRRPSPWVMVVEMEPLVRKFGSMKT